MSLVLTYNVGRDGPLHFLDENSGEEGTLLIQSGNSPHQVKLVLDFKKSMAIKRDVVYLRDDNEDGGNR